MVVVVVVVEEKEEEEEEEETRRWLRYPITPVSTRLQACGTEVRWGLRTDRRPLGRLLREKSQVGSQQLGKPDPRS